MCSRLFRATPQQGKPAGRQLGKKPTQPGRKAPTEPTGRIPLTLRNYRNAYRSINQAPTGKGPNGRVPDVRCGARDLVGRVGKQRDGVQSPSSALTTTA